LGGDGVKKRLPLFLVVLALVFSVLVLAGCGGGGKQTGSQPAKDQQGGSQPAKEESVADLFSKGKKVEGMSYDYTMTSKDISMSGKVWLQGKKMKTESTFEGQKMISFIDGDTNTFITYYPDQNTAMKISSPPTDRQTETPTDFTSDIDTTKVKVLETTVYDGVKCRVLEVTEKDNKTLVKMWVREDYGIPIRVESTDPDGGKFVMEYKNLQVGSIPADVFQLPAGVEVTDMNEMMKNMPQIPNMPNRQ